MTTSTEAPAGAQLNGQGPPPAAQDDPGTTSAGERVMGVIGIAFAVGLLAIGIDLVTGGALARLLAGLGTERDADAGSGG